MSPTITQADNSKILLAAASIVVIVAGVKLAADLIAPFLFAIVLTILLYPLLDQLMRRGLSRFWAVVSLVIGVVGSFVATMALVYFYLAQIITNWPEYETLLHQQLEPVNQWLTSVGIDFESVINSGLFPDNLASIVLNSIQSIASNIIGLGIFLFLLLLMVAASPLIVDRFHKNLDHGSQLIPAFKQFCREVQQVYTIQTMSNGLTAIAITVELWLFNVDFALFWGILVFFLSYIPNIGGILAAIPPTIMTFILFGPTMALVVLIVGLILSLTMDNIVTPRFQGSAFDVPVLIVFASLLVWSWMFGALGVLLALPLTLAIRAILQRIPEAKPLYLLFTNSATKIQPTTGGII